MSWPRRTLILAAALLGASATALADGDPASDVLISANVFYPYRPPVAAQLQKTLNAETAATAQAHFPIKVALIASQVDLGAVPDLFAQPQRYASFLDQEIRIIDEVPHLLVVMPNGYGLAGFSAPASAALSSLRKPASAASDELARAAIAAVPRLAAAAGHPIQTPAATGGSASRSSGGSGSSAVTIIVVAVAALAAVGVILAARRRRAARPKT